MLAKKSIIFARQNIERKSTMSKHKTLGQVYTPQWIVCEILDIVGYNGKDILKKYILEPSCGDGAFLTEIVRRYIKIARENQADDKQIILDIETYIVGVEIDEKEYAKCIENLNTLLKNEFQLPKINWNILNTNTLDFYKNNISKFDFVVGNPPYIRIHNLDLETRETLKNDFQFSEGTIDIYLSFFEMGLKMLKTSGLLGYITPNSYLHNSSYKKFREFLKREKTVHTLIDFKANKLFKGFSTYTAISVFQKNYNKDFFTYKELENDKIIFVNNVKYSELNSKDWSFSNNENTVFLNDLNNGRNSAIKDFFDVQYGFATLRDKVFIAKITQSDNKNLVWFNNELIEKSILKTVVKGSRFKGVIDANIKIIFPYELIKGRYYVIPEDKMKTNYPNCYNYFLKNRTELENRDIDKGALWYEYGRSQGVQSIHNEKIVLSTLVNDGIEFYKLPKDVLMYSGLFIIKKNPHSEWRIIENTLQSEEFYKYIRLTSKDFSGGYKSITSKQIKEFKINYKNTLTLF
jgi:adenine-specific DNA-methyltransferase